MDKLFGGKERKPNEGSPNSQAALDAFLHNPADNLDVTHAPPPPPKLAKLDTTITRYPQALAVNHQAQLNRPVAPGKYDPAPRQRSPRPNKKGFVVRFADSYPDIIGEGGDESDVPVVEIKRNKLSRQLSRRPVPAPSGAPMRVPAPPGVAPPVAAPVDDFQPKPLGRTQTGYSSIYEPEADAVDDAPRPPPPRPNNADMLLPGRAANARFLETSGRRDENRRSFIELHRAQMRNAEGTAFAQASRTASRHDPDDPDRSPPAAAAADVPPDGVRRRPSAMPKTRTRPPLTSYSPAASIDSDTSSSDHHPHSSQSTLPPAPPGMAPPNGSSPAQTPLSVRMASVRLRDAVGAGDDALGAFMTRTRHLFELFRLHAETVKPLKTCSPIQCARAGLWWFLKGRMGLELAVRDRPGSPRSQMQNQLDRQQAYSNLAKGYWLCEEAIPDIVDAQQLIPDGQVAAAVQSLVSALRKLSQSMDRNGIMPPEEPFLPQTMDNSIWLDYPPLSQDIVALLSGNWGSGLTAVQHPTSSLQLLDAFPLGDTSESFNYARVMADAFLMEQGREMQRVCFPCILSVVRPRQEKGLVLMIASQNGSVQLAVREDKNAGPTGDDVRWQNDACSLDVRLPRGFWLAVQLGQADYRLVWTMYDFAAKMQATLRPRSDEQVLSRNLLRSFQYLELEPATRAFPKEPVARCEVALMEKLHKESGPAAPRTWHCGFRVAVTTGPLTRTVSGVQHSFSPSLPVQFGFFRAEGDAPALSVKYESGRQRGRMVFIFGDDKERVSLQSLLTGTALGHDERAFADVPLKAFTVSQSVQEPTGMAPFGRMPWRAARVINDELRTGGGEQPPTVLADKLRVVLEYQNGTVTDRVNVAPGELSMRLEVSNAKVLRVLRQPQKDMTVSVSEAQVPKELPRELSDAMQLVQAHQTIRSYEFSSLKDLHSFQAALTGFEVVFDALAATFAISRRRMVVPIHKKWEAGYTRIQVVRLEDRQMQLLAFFEDFHHGHCMNFVLKGTDVYESFHRGGKSGIKFVDAKFPLPRVPADKDADFDDVAFVCLDLPDLPGEHDDITIMFEKESGMRGEGAVGRGGRGRANARHLDRDRLCELLPAPVKGSSRMSSRLK